MTKLSSVETMLVLMDVARTLNDFRPLDETLKSVCENVSRLCGYDFSALLMLNEEQNALIIRGSWGLQPDYVEDINRRRCLLLEAGTASMGPSVRAFLQGSVVAIADLEVEPRADGPRKTAQRFGYRSIVSVPVVVRSRIIGVLNCYLREPHEYTPDELEILQLVARLAGVAIETSRIAAEQRQAVVELRAQTERLCIRNEELAQLFAAVSRLTGELAQADGAVLGRIAEVLADMTHRSVLVCGPDGRVLVAAGDRADSAREHSLSPAVHARLDQEALFTTGARSYVRVGAGSGPARLGCLVLIPALEDAFGVATVAATHAAAIIAAELQAERTDRALGTYARPTMLLALAHGLYTADGVRDAARVLGVAPDEAVRLLAVTCSSVDDARQLVRSLADLKSWGWPALVCVAHGTTALVLLDGREASATHLKRAGQIMVRARPQSVQRMGVSTVMGIGELPIALEQAMAAAHVSTAGPWTVVYEDLGVFGQVARDLPRSQALQVVEHALGPLRAHDAEHGTDLVRTVDAYVRAGGRPRDAAQMLNIHVNTLHLRLRRCCEVAHLDLHDLHDLSGLVLAVELDRILRGDPCAAFAPAPAVR